MTITTHDRTAGCIVGLAVGDALGAPYEKKDRITILEMTDGGVTGFDHAITAGTATCMLNRPRPGAVTEDTHLALTVAMSLITSARFDIGSQARALVKSYRCSGGRWDRETRIAIGQIDAYLRSDGMEGRSPFAHAPPPRFPRQGCGNGVAVRIAPYAVFHAARHGDAHEPMLSDVMDLGLMTHGDPRASFSAAMIATVITKVLTDGGYGPGPGKDALTRLLDYRARTLEERHRFFRQDRSDTVSVRMRRAFELVNDADALRRGAGTSSYALESVPFAVATFLRHPTDFRSGALEAVNAGGDTGSIAAMAGAMIGANVGLAGIPDEWIRNVRDTTTIRAVAHELSLTRF